MTRVLCVHITVRHFTRHYFIGLVHWYFLLEGGICIHYQDGWMRRKKIVVSCQENQFTVTVLASISVNMNSPPSKSPFKYNSALKIKVKYRSVQTPHQTEGHDSDHCTCLTI